MPRQSGNENKEASLFSTFWRVAEHTFSFFFLTSVS